MPILIKYIVIDEAFPVLFFASVKHSQMSFLGKITSAGFVKIEGDAIHCFGESISLKMAPGPFDEKIIKAFLGLG